MELERTDHRRPVMTKIFLATLCVMAASIGAPQAQTATSDVGWSFLAGYPSKDASAKLYDGGWRMLSKHTPTFHCRPRRSFGSFPASPGAITGHSGVKATAP